MSPLTTTLLTNHKIESRAVQSAFWRADYRISLQTGLFSATITNPYPPRTGEGIIWQSSPLFDYPQPALDFALLILNEYRAATIDLT